MLPIRPSHQTTAKTSVDFLSAFHCRRYCLWHWILLSAESWYSAWLWSSQRCPSWKSMRLVLVATVIELPFFLEKVDGWTVCNTSVSGGMLHFVMARSTLLEKQYSVSERKMWNIQSVLCYQSTFKLALTTIFSNVRSFQCLWARPTIAYLTSPVSTHLRN